MDHLQTNGKLERLNYTIKIPRSYFRTWDEVVLYITMIIREAICHYP